MLGYVRAFKPELKMREYELYQGVYCSLCKALGRRYSPLAQLFLSYDFALAALLRLATAPEGCTFAQSRCPYRPAKKCLRCTQTAVFDACADALIITVYYKIIDNLRDPGFFSRLSAALLFPLVRLMHRKAAKAFPAAEQAVAAAMARQRETEQAGACGIDAAADPTAQALGEIFAVQAPEEKRPALQKLGYMLGRYVYILDAAEDLERDRRRGGFNPFAGEAVDTPQARKAFAARVRGMLNLTQDAALEALDAAGAQRFGGILENIVLDGLDQSAARVLAVYEGGAKAPKRFTVE